MKAIIIIIVLVFEVYLTGFLYGQRLGASSSLNTFEVDVSGDSIKWTQFPDFSLPLPVIYHGDKPSDMKPHPLNKGFSHIEGHVRTYAESIPYQKRVYLWTGIAGADGWARKNNQPWEIIKSPWGNDIQGYRKKWWGRLVYIKSRWDSQKEIKERDFDIIITDIEMARHSDKEILAIKNNPLVPKNYQILSDGDFIKEYKQAMRALYNEPLKLIRDSLSQEIKISSYGDTPIRRDWWGIGTRSVKAGLEDGSIIDYLVQDYKGELNSDFYNNLDFISPSAYYFYDPSDNPVGKNYLSYLLFQIDANRSWSDKPQLLFVWMNYHLSSSPKMDPISASMAEATAIFPLMSGVGIYNWRYNHNKKGNYEYFIRGLYRMSKFNDFYDGNEEYVVPEPAHQSFVEKNPIWRGVANHNKILIAAHNPYADDDEVTELKAVYKDWSQIIRLEGKEVFLQAFNLR